MDTLNVWRALTRNRLAVIPIILLTVGTAVWIAFIRSPSYIAQSSLLLLPPPPAATEAQIEKDPALGGLNSDNPYARSYDPVALIGVVSLAIGTDASKATIERAAGGADFTVSPTTRYGVSSPFVDITAIGDSAEQAIAVNKLVVDAFNAELARLQQVEGVSGRYFITSELSTPEITAVPNGAETVQLLLLAMVPGLVCVFGAVAVGDAVREALRLRDRDLRRREESGVDYGPLARGSGFQAEYSDSGPPTGRHPPDRQEAPW